MKGWIILILCGIAYFNYPTESVEAVRVLYGLVVSGIGLGLWKILAL